MDLGKNRITGPTPWLTTATSFLVVVIMLLSGPFPGTLAADIHDPISVRADVSDDAIATTGIDNEQRNSDVAIDHLGRIHTVWEDERSGHFQIMYARSDDGARSFGPSILVNTHYGQGLVLFKPNLAVDGYGNPHVVWEDPRNTISTSIDIYYARSYDGGDSFGPNIRVNSDSANTPQITPTVAVGNGGVVHVAYASGVGSAADIFISTSTDGGATFEAMVEVTDETGAALQQNPMVAVDGSGLAHMVWTDQRSGDMDIYYAYRNQQGLVSSNVRVNDNVGGTTQRDAAIVVDDTGPLAVWRDERGSDPDIYLARRTSPTTFSTDRLVNTDVQSTSQVDPDISVDPEGDLHVVWKGVEASQSDIFLANSSDGGLSFTSDIRVNVDVTTSAAQGQPSIAAGDGGAIAVTWDDQGVAARDTDILVSFRTPSGAQPQRPVSDDIDNAFESYPDTAVGQTQRMHSVWLDNRRGLLEVFYSFSVNRGQGWGAVTRVADGDGNSVQLTPDMAVGADGTVHVVWTDYRNDVPQVFYANNKGKSSGFNPSLRVDDSTTEGFALHPSIAVASNGSATLTWLDGRDGGARGRISYSIDGGGSWESSLPIPSSDEASVHSPPVLAIREGLIVVAFTDDLGGLPRVYISTGSSVPNLDDAIPVEETGSGSPAMYVTLALDEVMEGPVHIAWVDVRTGQQDVWYARYDPVSETFGSAFRPAANVSNGPRFQPSVAAGDGGTLHLAWIDLGGTVTTARLLTAVPGLDPPVVSDLPTSANSPASNPSLAFTNHQLSVVLVEDTGVDPDISCALWDNALPDSPEPSSPSNNGWVTVGEFDLTVNTGSDSDGDPVLVRFEVMTPGDVFLTRPFGINPRFTLTGAAEGTYSWRATTTDGFGAYTTEEWTFTVDLTPPEVPQFDPLPEYTPGNTCTVSWTEATDSGGGLVFYRVIANQDIGFTPPHLGDSGWLTVTNHTFEDLPATTVHYTLSARDEAGNTVVATSTVHSIQDVEAPKVFISVEPALVAEEGEDVTFDASSSSDNNGIISFEWDFDSDGTVDSTDALSTWAFSEAGQYHVTITITDVAGNIAVYSDYTLSVKDISVPTIQLDVDPGIDFNEGTTVTFDATGTDDPSGIDVIRWFLDDAAVPFATGPTAQMTFPDPGVHEVEIEALDIWGNLANMTVVLTVRDITAPMVIFETVGPLDNTKVEFFTLYVEVIDNGGVEKVDLFYKTQDQGVFSEVPMTPSTDSENEWFKDELAPGGKGNVTYYVKATDLTGNTNKTDYMRILITGVEDPTPHNGNGENGFDIMENLWLLLLIVVIGVVGVGGGIAVSRRRKGEPAPSPTAGAKENKVAAQTTSATPETVASVTSPAKDKALCAVEEVYFIHNDGRLILAATSVASADRDAQDVFAGMFTAIQDFIKESMSREGNLGSFEYGDNRIVIERGGYITCAVTIFGPEPPNMREDIREMVRQIEGNYAGIIERWDGDKGKISGIHEFGKRILGLTGGIDRETVVKSKEKKGVKLLSEVEFFQGFVRLKAGVKNDTDTVITDAALDIVYDDNVLRIDHIQPVYEYKRGKVHLGNINVGEKKSVAFNFDPVICMESMIDGTLTYRDVAGKLQVVSMKSRRADIVCPIFFTKENANTAMLKRLIREELATQDSKVFRYPDGLAPLQAFELCKGVVHLHDVKFVREFIEDRPTWLGEAWFYGETKVKGYKIVIRVTVREDSHTAEFFVASSEMGVITGLLAELGHSLNRMLKEKYMGRLKVQPIVDQRLKKDITDQPLLLEKEV
jgi:hypothetical protein